MKLTIILQSFASCINKFQQVETAQHRLPMDFFPNEHLHFVEDMDAAVNLLWPSECYKLNNFNQVKIWKDYTFFLLLKGNELVSQKNMTATTGCLQITVHCLKIVRPIE